ncbi:MAG TPA: glycosyltransferase family 39 protein [Chthoniobacteraceae bacterium]|nr:glycosyltransferase family 39 protein [Chthoniobacteraceae bacterium]
MKRGAFLLAVALLFLRVAFFARTDLYPEEAYYWNYAAHLDIGYLDHPPMVAWLIHTGSAIFGDNEFGVRASLLICSLITSFFAFRLTALLFNQHAAAVAVLLVQVLPFFFLTGFMITPDAPLTACWTGTLYFLARALLQERPGAWLGLGVCLGLGLLSKYSIALLGLATLVFLVLDRKSRRWWWHPAPYVAVAVALAIFSPVVIWNAQHDWASFAFQSADRVAEKWRFSLHELLLAVLFLLTPVGVVFAWKSLRGTRSHPPSDARSLLFARVFVLVPLSVFVLFSLTHRVKLNWTGPLWLPMIPAMAALLVDLQPGALRRASIGSLAALTIVYVAFLQYLASGLPGVSYSVATELLPVGWSEMGLELEAQRAAIPRPANGRVLLVGMDRNFIASEAAFYQSRKREAIRETTSAHLFGGRGLMYEFWFPSKEQWGATLLLVSFQRHDLDAGRVRARCAPLGPIEEHWLERDGRRIRQYYTRVAENYSPRAER